MKRTKPFVAALLVWFALLILPPPLRAHSGGLDSLGCHYSRKAGGYHCHRGPLAGRSFGSKAEAQDALAVLQEKSETASPSTPEPTPAGNPSTTVWVNTKSSVYHCPGARWYGATKVGAYMSQKVAQQKGNRPAYGTYCP